MQFFIIILLICLVVYLFTLHVLAKEDLVFVRRNITLESLFNISFYTAVFSLLFARIFFIIANPSSDYFNPLVFLLFPYFPGLSLSGGIVGGILFIQLYNKRKRIPVGRIFDFFLLSLLAALPVGLFGASLLVGFSDLFKGILLPFIFLIALFFCIKVLLPLNVRGELKDGSLGSLILIIISTTLLLSEIARKNFALNISAQFDNIFLILFLVFGLFILIKQERKGQFVKKHLL